MEQSKANLNKLIKQGFNGINHVDPLMCLIRLKPSFIICSSRENLENIKLGSLIDSKNLNTYNLL